MNLNEAIQILEENNYLVEFGYLSPGAATLDRMNGYSLDMNGNRYKISGHTKSDDYNMQEVLDDITETVQRRLGYDVKPVKGMIGLDTLKCIVIDNNGNEFKVSINCEPYRSYIKCGKLKYDCEFNRIPYMVSEIVKDLEK